jgi:hypothetical protein
MENDNIVEMTVKFKAPYSMIIDDEGLDEFPGETRNEKLKNVVEYLFKEEGIFGIVDDEYELVEVKEIKGE